MKHKSYLRKPAIVITAGFWLMQSPLALAAPLPLSLADSIQLALKQNPSVQIANAQKEKSGWSLTEAKASKYPTFSLSSSYSANNQSTDLTSGDTNSSLRMNWQLYSGGRIDGQIEQAKIGVKSADLTVAKVEQQLILDTTTAYYNVLQAKNMVDVGRETVANLKEHQRVVQANYDAGIVAKSDVLRSEVELTNAEQNLTKYENQYDLAVSALNTILNENANTELQLTDTLIYTPDSRTLDDSIALAKTNRPDIVLANMAVKSAEAGVKVAESGNLPTVAASASTGWKNNLLPYSDNNNWSVGLSANWNIFDAGVTNAKVKEAKSSQAAAALQAEQVSDSVEQEVRQSYLSMREAEKRLQSVNVAVDKAEEDLYIAKEKYSAGVGTNLDVIDAQLALTQAKTNRVQALYDYNVNRAKLDKAIGMPAK